MYTYILLRTQHAMRRARSALLAAQKTQLCITNSSLSLYIYIYMYYV